MMRVCLALLCVWLPFAAAIPIDNGLQGDPEIECGPNSIQVTFNTLNSFEGHAYVKGLFDQEDCKSSGDGTRAAQSIALPFDSCNVERERSLNPKGIFVRTTVVLTFHPNFVTKIDRAFTLQCFYMEADKTVSTDIEVSSFISTGFATQFVPMPICRYEILDAPDGNIVTFAEIGQPVFHKWTCDSETVDTFCMYVYSCFVVDAAGNDRLDLIDEQGCAIDRYLMGNIEYSSDLMGVKEVHVFKYADRPALAFQCQIALSIKEPLEECVRPECPEPEGRGDGSRRVLRAKRSAPQATAGVVDVISRLETLDIHDQPAHWQNSSPQSSLPAYQPVVFTNNEDVCVSSGLFVLVALAAVALLAGIVVLTYMIHSRAQHK